LRTGIPAAILFVLYRSRVPELATWKRDCAWLRSIVQRAQIMGVRTRFVFDPDTITTESISVDHLRLLHKIFVDGDQNMEHARASATGTPSSGDSGVALLQAAPQEMALLDGSVHDAIMVHHAPGAGMQAIVINTGGTRKTKRVGTATSQAPPPPQNRFWALVAMAKTKLERTGLRTKTVALRKSFSTFFFKNEREQLLLQLLEWAKHDKSTLVAEPRDNQLRWRTQYEWEALRDDEAELGTRDTTERAAFYKYRSVLGLACSLRVCVLAGSAC
jgi:hypothetical protein